MNYLLEDFELMGFDVLDNLLDRLDVDDIYMNGINLIVLDFDKDLLSGNMLLFLLFLIVGFEELSNVVILSNFINYEFLKEIVLF